jgi:hypothetical protein
MPLDKSGSKQSIGRNIATELAAGKPRRQAIAIAESVRRRAIGEMRGKKTGHKCGCKCGMCRMAHG